MKKLLKSFIPLILLFSSHIVFADTTTQNKNVDKVSNRESTIAYKQFNNFSGINRPSSNLFNINIDTSKSESKEHNKPNYLGIAGLFIKALILR